MLSFHEELIKFPSVSNDEKAVVDYTAEFLKQQGLTVELQEVEKDRNNVFAYKGKQRDTAVLLTSHLDTVPPFFDYYKMDNGSIAGRGSADDKGSVATQTFAMLELLESGEIQEGDVSLLFVVGEESGGDGMRKANDLNLSWKSVRLFPYVDFKPDFLRSSLGSRLLVLWSLVTKAPSSSD
jgi:acetylornithine deacetylase